MDETTGIMDAAKAGKLDEVQRLLAAQPDLAAARDASGLSLLMLLAYRGAGDLAARVAEQITPDVFEAAALGDVGRLAQILDASPQAVHHHSADGWTPLHLAGFFGNLEVAMLLLARGADVSAYGANAMHNMPLHAALSGQQEPELLRLLLEHGAQVNAAAATHVTPLHLAASRGNLAAIEMLLARGADKSATMDNGQSPADLARERGFPAAAEALA